MKRIGWDTILDLDAHEVFFHAVHGDVLSLLQSQVQDDGQIVLWGRVDEDEDEDGCEHARGRGEISCTDAASLEDVSIGYFYDEDGMIFILAGNARRANDEEVLMELSISSIVGGLRITDDPEIFEFYSLEELPTA